MKRINFFTALLCLLMCMNAGAQNPILREILRIKPVHVRNYKTSGPQENVVVLKMNFGSPAILNPADAAALKGKIIERIDLVYTAFQVADTFSQPRLNQNRFLNLEKLLPGVLRQTTIRYNIIGQDGCRNEAEAHNYFHGFVIWYKEPPSPVSVKMEMEKINSILLSDSLGSDTVVVIQGFSIRRHREKTGYYLPILKSKRKRGIVCEKKGIWGRRMQTVRVTDTIRYKHERKKFVPSSYAMSFAMGQIKDSTIFTVLKRNKEWKDILFVCDVTGSMSPYSSQLMVWHKLNHHTGRAKYFSFFNDGDLTPDHQKKIGATGGIYHSASSSFEEVSGTMSLAMSKGFGGDGPENNCEAILAALKLHPEIKEIVMIADNWAPVKDLKLADQIRRPVRIILCGAAFGVNVDYLDLARKTGGSIHTIEQDITDLMKMQEGSKIKIGKSVFKISGGKFVPIFET